MDDHDVALQREKLDRLESASDPLIDAIGYLESLRPSSPAFGDEKFVTWLAHERRVRASAAEALSPDTVTALARRLCLTVMAERAGLHLVDHLPEQVATRGGLPISSAIVELAKHRQAAVVDLAIAAGTGRELWDAECESAVAVPEMLPRGEYVALTVSGDSMEPLLHSGDVVLVKRGGELKAGSIVVMRDTDAGYVVKKVGRIEARSVELLSLNPAYGRRTVRRTRTSVLGTVLLRWCAHQVT
ncbi:MAG TPA: S24 family peptidase [Gemmatimonadaceae bacterium]|nr:S24 family peptidase [Gemmatimonadaceae bacterium]